MTRADTPKTSEANLSIVVVADAALRLRCQTILAEQRIASRGTSLAGAHWVLRRYRPRVLLLEAVRRGAWGHLAERDLSRDLPKAVRMVAARQSWLPRRLSAAIVAELIERGHAEERN